MYRKGTCTLTGDNVCDFIRVRRGRRIIYESFQMLLTV